MVDDEDYPLLNRHNWFVHKTRGGLLYVECGGITKERNIFMHRLVMPAMKGNLGLYEIDHVNRNPLDNRKKNLRWVTLSENRINRKRFNGKKLNSSSPFYTRYANIYAISGGVKNKYKRIYSVIVKRNNITLAKRCHTLLEALAVRKDFYAQAKK